MCDFLIAFLLARAEEKKRKLDHRERRYLDLGAVTLSHSRVSFRSCRRRLMKCYQGAEIPDSALQTITNANGFDIRLLQLSLLVLRESWRSADRKGRFLLAPVNVIFNLGGNSKNETNRSGSQ